jgi:hypothetical protein
MLIVGDFSLDTFKRDIVIETRNRELKRISELHLAYMALQYPLLFPYGERGERKEVPFHCRSITVTNSTIDPTSQIHTCLTECCPVILRLMHEYR